MALRICVTSLIAENLLAPMGRAYPYVAVKPIGKPAADPALRRAIWAGEHAIGLGVWADGDIFPCRCAARNGQALKILRGSFGRRTRGASNRQGCSERSRCSMNAIERVAAKALRRRAGGRLSPTIAGDVVEPNVGAKSLLIKMTAYVSMDW